MDKRRMKKEIFAYLAVYLEGYTHSDLSHQLKSQILKDKPTIAAQRRFERVKEEAIAQLFQLGLLNPEELSEQVIEKRGYR